MTPRRIFSRRLRWAIRVLCFCAVLLIVHFVLGFTGPYFFEYGKAGSGPIGRDGFLHIGAAYNELSWGRFGVVEWRGAKRESIETVIFDGSSVVPFEWSLITKRPIIITFMPDRIRVIDLQDLSGGYYSRRIEDEDAEAQPGATDNPDGAQRLREDH